MVQHGESRQPVLGCRLEPTARRSGPHRAKRTRRLWRSNAYSVQCDNHRLAVWWDPLHRNRLHPTGDATPRLRLDRLWHRASGTDNHVRNPHSDLDPAVRVSRTVHLHWNLDVDERRKSAELLSVTPALLEQAEQNSVTPANRASLIVSQSKPARTSRDRARHLDRGVWTCRFRDDGQDSTGRKPRRLRRRSPQGMIRALVSNCRKFVYVASPPTI